MAPGMTISERDRHVVWHPYTQSGLFPDNIAIVRGEGACLYDDQGRRYIDAISSWWVNLHGHAHPRINARVREQADQLEQAIFAGFTHEPAVSLAERLLALLPGYGKAFFSDNGSTAVEVSLKMALQYWRNIGIPRTRIVAMEQAYHGDTFGAMAVGQRGLFNAAFHDLLFDVERIPFPAPGREEESLDALRGLLERGDVAAFIAEPLVLGSGGMRMYGRETLENLFALCREHGSLIIADEVMTGFGRTDGLFATLGMRTPPDLLCLSKGLTGGYLPMGLTLATERVHAAFVGTDMALTLFHGHSYTANPLACAAANASLDLLLGDECQASIQRITEAQRTFIATVEGRSCLREPRCLGTIAAFDLEVSDSGYTSSVRQRVLRFFLASGILVRPLGNVLYILPPYCITAEQLAETHVAMHNFLDEFEKKRD